MKSKRARRDGFGEQGAGGFARRGGSRGCVRSNGGGEIGGESFADGDEICGVFGHEIGDAALGCRRHRVGQIGKGGAIARELLIERFHRLVAPSSGRDDGLYRSLRGSLGTRAKLLGGVCQRVGVF